jgi:OPA family sugar phosphate sensor protein UhpC-like MFS transporter
MLQFFRSRADAPPLTDAAEIARRYRRGRWLTFASITLGYGVFYTARLSLSVAKKPMIDAGVVDAEGLGSIGSALLLTYAFGRFTNGFLSDRAHIGRFMGVGLLASALLNLLFGLSSLFWVFVLVWALNGWFQSMGSAPSVVNIAHWFSHSERGTRYGVWSIAHSLGEGMTFVLTSALVAALGWRAAFFGPAALCGAVALALFFTVLDRPATYGLPVVADFRQDHAAPTRHDATTWELQLEVLRNPAVWVLGLAGASLYVARYGVNNWMVLYFQEAKGYGLVAAGFNLTVFTVAGLIGTALSGAISDRWFRAQRGPVIVLYGLGLIAALIAVFVTPAGAVWLDRGLMAVGGFSMGGLVCFLGGLAAIDICPKRATGAAMGLIGLFSYLGAAVQDQVSGSLLQASRTVVDGVTRYDFDGPFLVWIGATVASVLLSLVLFRVRHVE